MIFDRREKTLVPVCLDPWVMLGLAWGDFATCCNAYDLDFGSLGDDKDDPNIFNSESYKSLRQSLIDGRLIESCRQCPRKNGGGRVCSASYKSIYKCAFAY